MIDYLTTMKKKFIKKTDLMQKDLLCRTNNINQNIMNMKICFFKKNKGHLQNKFDTVLFRNRANV